MSDASDTVGWGDLLKSGRTPLLVALNLAIWLHAADSLLVATTLPSAVAEIGGASWVGWAFALYQLGSILAGVATGVTTARLGLRTCFVAAGTLFGLGCTISALAPDMAVLLAGRLAQGVGGGWQLALVYVALDRLFPNRLMPRLIALNSAVWSVSAFCGPLVGGLFANAGHWRWAFWAFAAQAALFVLLILVTVSDRRATVPGAPRRLPLRRFACLAGDVLLVAGAGADPAPLAALPMCVAAALLLALFLHLEHRDRSNAMLPRRPFWPGSIVGAGLAMVLTLSVATTALFTYGPFLLQWLYGMSPLGAGYVIAVESVAWGLGAIAVGGARIAIERWLIRIGSLVVTVGLAGLAVTMPRGPLWAALPFVALQGLGFGVMFGFVIRRVVASAAQGERERTAAAIPATQQFGYALGAAVTGMVANALGFSQAAPDAVLRAVALWIFAAFLPVALVGNLAAWRLARDRDGD